jgi:hypothetical protein
MQFQTTAEQPTTNPPVTLTFSGQMVLRPGANNTCEIGINRFSRNHLFQMMLTVETPNRPPTIHRLFTGPLTAPLSVRLHPDPNPASGDFVVFAPTPEPFDRAAGGNDDKDYRWSLNLKTLHGNAQVNGGVIPFMTAKTGILYTPNLSDLSLNPRLTQSGSPDIQLHQIAEDLAISIVPQGQTRVLLQWEDFGEARDLLLPLRLNDPNRYTVAFINYPPSLEAEPHDELADYYRVLVEAANPIPVSMRFGLAFDQITRSDEIPCMPVTLNP